MTKLLILFIFSLNSMLHFAQEETSVLFIGNSFTFMNDMPSIFKEIAESKGKKVFVDHQLKSGDLVLFLANLPHGVDVNTFSGERSPKFSDYFNGRCFLNMNLVESHHVVDRQTSEGI